MSLLRFLRPSRTTASTTRPDGDGRESAAADPRAAEEVAEELREFIHEVRHVVEDPEGNPR